MILETTPPLKPMVFVVDDDPAVCGSLKFSLELEGFAVRTYSGAAALLADRDAGPSHCLVIDYKLAGMNGLELLARLRERQVSTPAILITSHPTSSLRKRAADAGIPIVEKPLLGNALSERVGEACRR